MKRDWCSNRCYFSTGIYCLRISGIQIKQKKK